MNVGQAKTRFTLPHNDPDASMAFYRDTLGFEVRNDVGNVLGLLQDR